MTNLLYSKEHYGQPYGHFLHSHPMTTDAWPSYHCKKKTGHRMANPLFCQYPTILWPFPKLRISCYLYHHPMAISSLRPLYGQKSSDRLIRPPLWPDLIVAINRNTHKNLKITIYLISISPHTVHKNNML